MRSRPILIVSLGALLIAVLVFFKMRANEEKKTASAGGAAAGRNSETRVTVQVVQPVSFENAIQATGTVLANDEVDLRAEASGRITKIYFREGGNVSEGQLLLKINDADLQAQLRKQHHSLRLAEAMEARGKQLLAKEGISREEYDVITNQLNTSRSDIEMTRALIAKTEVRAPFSGVIGLKNVSEGSYLSPSVTIARLQQISPVKIDFSIPERYMGSVSQGDPLTFRIQGVDETFNARVFAVEPKIDLNTRTVLIRAICDNTGNKVLPGAFAEIRFPLRRTSNALLVPTQSVIPELKSQKVFVAQGGKSQPRKVEIGMRNDTAVQILSGLQPGDSVITSGVLYLKPGGKVKVVAVK